MGNENALMDFLMYSYWGFDSKMVTSENTDVIQYCARRAYLDLARTVKFKYSTSRLDDMKKDSTLQDEAIEFENKKKDIIEKICISILNPVDVGDIKCTDEQFNSWHEKKCNEIKDKINNSDILKDSKSFTIGQAQKWVNMTLKYLWLLDMLPKGLSEKSLHVPIDSFILQALKEKVVDKITGSGDDYKYDGCKWSALDYEKYKELQEEIKKIADKLNMTPIAWEGQAWIEVAKKRNNSKSQKK